MCSFIGIPLINILFLLLLGVFFNLRPCLVHYLTGWFFTNKEQKSQFKTFYLRAEARKNIKIKTILINFMLMDNFLLLKAKEIPTI